VSQPDQIQPAQRQAAPTRLGVAARAGILLAALGLFVSGGAWLLHASIDPQEERDAAHFPAVRNEALSEIKSWGYQLQGLRIGEAAGSQHDLLVVDEQLAGSGPGQRGLALSALKRKPDGSRRIVLAYLSIGEAESYRGYWQKTWTQAASEPAASEPHAEIVPIGGTRVLASAPRDEAARRWPAQTPTPAAPAWLGQENPQWRGNFVVRFWDPGWRAILSGSSTAVIDRLIAVGFDGVYLDRADVYAQWTGERPQARADMIDLVTHLSAYAKAKNPEFLVALQNAEELLGNRKLRRALDLVAKEDLYFGIGADAQPNSQQDVKASLAHLKRAQAEGLPVLVVEYVDTDAAMETARKALQAEGFIGYFAPRDLSVLRTGP